MVSVSKITRSADICPNHPEERGVITETITAPDGMVHSIKLIQHKCAMESCSSYLGWSYEGHKNGYKAGPGKCPENIYCDILQRHKNDERKYTIQMFSALASGIFIGIWCGIYAHTDSFWHLWHTCLLYTSPSPRDS